MAKKIFIPLFEVLCGTLEDNTVQYQPSIERIDTVFKQFLNSQYTDHEPLFIFCHWSWPLSEEHMDLYYKVIDYVIEKCKTLGIPTQNVGSLFVRSNEVQRLVDDMNKKYNSNMFKSFEFFMLRDYYYNKYVDNSIIDWNYKTEKSLCLFGKTSREIRTFALRDLVANGDLNEDKMLWTLELSHFNKNLIDKIKRWMPDLEDYKKYERSFDDELYKIYGEMGALGYPYDKELYKSTFMSFVFETNADRGSFFKDFDFITEKVWRPIFNKHPFMLIVSSQNIIDTINGYGMETFEQFYLDGEYDSKHLAKNISKYYNKFRKYIKENTDQIHEIVEHNFKAYHNYIDKEIQDLAGIDKLPVLRISPTLELSTFQDLVFFYDITTHMNHDLWNKTRNHNLFKQLFNLTN